jgi:uncharacterized protein
MTMKRIKSYSFSLILLIIITGSISTFAQRIPSRPEPPRLVNDFVGLLSSDEANSLERKLVSFSDSTTTQIAIVITDDLGGYVPDEYAERIGDSWGVGLKGKNNGIVILVKTSSAGTKGDVVIKTGYGIEGAIPDITCGRIVNYEIIPAFRKGEYFEGLDKATNTLMSLARGEFSADQYNKKSGGDIKKAAPIGVFLIVFIILAIVFGSGKSNQNNIGGRKGGGNLPFWLLLAMMNSGRGSHRGSWGGFSGGGGGSGGFGGFGGGSFGGGGAGGSW